MESSVSSLIKLEFGSQFHGGKKLPDVINVVIYGKLHWLKITLLDSQLEANIEGSSMRMEEEQSKDIQINVSPHGKFEESCPLATVVDQPLASVNMALE